MADLINDELFQAPKNFDDALKKWDQATKTIKLLYAAGYVPADKLHLAINLADGLEDAKPTT